MNLGNTPGQSTDTTELLNIDINSEYRRTSWTDWGGQTRVSAWVDLIKGEKYYIEAVHLENWHTDHFSMGVEI
jgi:glutamate formiminotransferase